MGFVDCVILSLLVVTAWEKWGNTDVISGIDLINNQKESINPTKTTRSGYGFCSEKCMGKWWGF
jgi:hypothetical protein